ncbi:MAG: signal peptidase II [Alphaproteobacteria bacterium]|jgi:signal peptidase II|nr:signal peptidase II [Alphaproteobacteria bacterium]
MLRRGIALAAAVLVADQLSKLWLLDWLAGHDGQVQLTGFFNLVTVWNRGISFGLLQSGEAGRWLLSIVSLVVCAALVVWLRRVDRLLPALALGAVIGGALGNVADRLLRGAVADFFDFHLMGYHWPAFNIADSAITIGVGMLLLDAFRAGDKRAEIGPEES